MSDLPLLAADASVSRVPTDAQLLLHVDANEAAEVARTTGVTLSTTPLSVSSQDGWHALHPSPDEWLLIGASGDAGDLVDRFALVDRPHSLVDVSNRSLSLQISGGGAVSLLAGACSMDLERMAVDSCTRTLMGKVTVLLWRWSDGWRLSYARSLDGYVRALLYAIAQDMTGPINA